MLLRVPQPRNVRNGQLEFVFNPRFGSQITSKLIQAQKVIDSEVIRLSAPYVPFDKGILSKSAILNTDIGSGLVKYATPYASKLYYNPQFSFQGAPIRGGLWFERMKVTNKEYIRRKAGEKL